MLSAFFLYGLCTLLWIVVGISPHLCYISHAPAFSTEGQAFYPGNSGRVFPKNQVRETIHDLLCPDDRLHLEESADRIDVRVGDLGECKEPRKFG